MQLIAINGSKQLKKGLEKFPGQSVWVICETELQTQPPAWEVLQELDAGDQKAVPGEG